MEVVETTEVDVETLCTKNAVEDEWEALSHSKLEDFQDKAQNIVVDDNGNQKIELENTETTTTFTAS